MNIRFRLYFDAETGTVTSADLEPAISIDHTMRIADNIQTLRRALGITTMKAMAAGSAIKIYKWTTTLGDPQAAEGDIVPLSKAERKLDRIVELEPIPYRVLTTGQAIQKVGRERAINEKDSEIMKQVRQVVRKNFFDIIQDGTGVAAGGTNLQMAAAQLWGSLSTYYEDKEVTPIFFVNPLDIATYLGSASVGLAQAFGFSYISSFLGLGNAFVTPRVPQGEVWATVTENLNGAYVPQGGDVGESFDLTYDETGMVGMTHYAKGDRFSVETLLVLGCVFYAEDLAGIYKSVIGDGPEPSITLDKETATVTAAAGEGHTVTLTATTVPADAEVAWASSAEGKATVSDEGVVTGVAAGSANITATITVDGETYTATCAVTVE